MRASPPSSPAPLLDPLRAWSRDLESRPGATSIGSADAHWLELSLALHRLATLGPDARDAWVQALANPEELESDHPDGSPPPAEPAPIDVRTIVRQLTQPRTDAERGEAMSVVQGIVESMENHHAFNLAFATLSAARRAVPDLSPLRAGRVMAQQGRVARQIGDLDTAGDLYAMVHELGTLHAEEELLVRGRVGAGLVAETRGNFPAARSEYLRALEHADAAPRIAATAHHGLMVAASRAGDLATALHHAWAAFEGVAGDPLRRVDRILNLAELARKAGDARVALRAFRTVLEHTDLARLRLPALGGAVQAAAALGERATVMSLVAQAEREAAASGIPYESAKLWLELAEAFDALDDRQRAMELARRAAAIAGTHAFHEVDILAATLAERIARRGERTASERDAVEPDDAASREILRRLDALAGAGRSMIVG